MTKNKIISENMLRWNIQSKECYESGCDCKHCTVFDVLGNNCRMKYVVGLIYEKLGEPPEILNVYDISNIMPVGKEK